MKAKRKYFTVRSVLKISLNYLFISFEPFTWTASKKRPCVAVKTNMKVSTSLTSNNVHSYYWHSRNKIARTHTYSIHVSSLLVLLQYNNNNNNNNQNKKWNFQTTVNNKRVYRVGDTDNNLNSFLHQLIVVKCFQFYCYIIIAQSQHTYTHTQWCKSTAIQLLGSNNSSSSFPQSEWNGNLFARERK